MEAIEMVRFIIGAAVMLCGLIVYVIEMIGVFRFRYVLNRMHAAALGDTLGLGCMILGLVLINGWNMTSVKLLCVPVFLWISSPTASHLISRLEVTTDEEQEAHYEKREAQK